MEGPSEFRTCMRGTPRITNFKILSIYLVLFLDPELPSKSVIRFLLSAYGKTCLQRTLSTTETCHQRTLGHFVKNTSFFIVFVWNRTCTQRKLSITSELFPPEQIFVQTNLFTTKTNFLSTFFCSQVKNQV
jgi:hypothetical protein